MSDEVTDDQLSEDDKALADLIASVAVKAVRTLDGRLAELERRIAELERHPPMTYRGVFREGRAYVRGDTVTFAGSLFYALQDTMLKPFDDQSANADLRPWQLCCRRGRDGK